MVDYQFNNKEYRRMFHPRLPEICLHVTHNMRISDYELQRTFRVSKEDILYIYFALSCLGVINLGDGNIARAKVVPLSHDLSFYEVKVLELVEHLTEHFESELEKERLAEDKAAQAERELKENDPLMEEAIQFVIDTQKVSISAIQRQFRIGYNRAACIVEKLEADGIVSPPGHNGNRIVIFNDSE